MNSNIIEILTPIVEDRKREIGLAPRVDDLNNKVIGILDNNWETGYVSFLDRVEKLLSERYKSSRIIRRTKLEKTAGAPADLIDELSSSCQAVINGLGA